MNKTHEYSKLFSEIYDVDDWYANYNYEQNTKRIMDLIGDASNKSLLELASGTGSYLTTFSNYYKSVAGLELSPYMRDISLKKYPQFPVYLANMLDFQINESFDAIALLNGGTVGITQETETACLEAINTLIGCCKKHLKSEGIIIIETYEQPNNIKEWVSNRHYMLQERHISLHSVKTVVKNNYAILTEHFLISPKDPNGKTEYIKEEHLRYLCTAEKIISLFKEQGFELKIQVPSFAIVGRDLLIFG